MELNRVKENILFPYTTHKIKNKTKKNLLSDNFDSFCNVYTLQFSRSVVSNSLQPHES